MASQPLNDLEDALYRSLQISIQAISDKRCTPPWTEPRPCAKSPDSIDQDREKTGSKRRASKVCMGPHCRQLFGVVPRGELNAFLALHVSASAISMNNEVILDIHDVRHFISCSGHPLHLEDRSLGYRLYGLTEGLHAGVLQLE